MSNNNSLFNPDDPRVKANPDAERHAEILAGIHDLYLQKNTAYGSSFSDTYKDLGIMSAMTRLSDKFNRAKTLAKHRDKGDINVGDEPLTDTLLDLANYAILTLMEIEKESKKS